MTTAIEGDIKGAYDNVDFFNNILKKILKEKISDKKFIHLITSSFKSKILEFSKIKDSFTGVPLCFCFAALGYLWYPRAKTYKLSKAKFNRIPSKTISRN